MPELRKYRIEYFDAPMDHGTVYDLPVVPKTLANRIIDGDHVIIRAHTIEIVYNYPLNGSYRFMHTNKRGWTRKRLAQAIEKDYVYMYHKSERYGIWGHDIRDLVIEGIEYETRTHVVRLTIGS